MLNKRVTSPHQEGAILKKDFGNPSNLPGFTSSGIRPSIPLANNSLALPVDTNPPIHQRLASKFSISMKSHDDVVNICSSKAADTSKFNFPRPIDDHHPPDTIQQSFIYNPSINCATKLTSPLEHLSSGARPKHLLDANVPAESAVIEDLTTPPFLGQQLSQRSQLKTMNSVETNILKDCLQAQIEPIEELQPL